MPQMRYQSAYLWLVLISALDVMLTMVVLMALEGFEVNPVAAAVIDTMGFPGATAFKFGVVVLVVVICEIVGRKDDRSGRNLITAAILISALPVAYSFALIFLTSKG